MIKKHKLLCLILGLICSFAITAQETSLEKGNREYMEYLEYKKVLGDFEKLQSKGERNMVIPRPKGLDPSVSFGGVPGNSKSWELYHDMESAKMAKEQKTNTSSLKAPIVLEEKEKPTEHTNDIVDNAEVIPNFGTGQNQNRSVLLNGIMGVDHILSEPATIIDEVEDNHALSIAHPINYNGDETIKINGSLENIMKSEGLSGDVDFYELFIQEGKKYLISFKNTGSDSFVFRAAIFDGDNTFVRSLAINNNKDFLLDSKDFTGSIKIAFMRSSIFSFDTTVFSNPEHVYRSGEGTTYELTTKEVAFEEDQDFYQMEFKEGDVFGISVGSLFKLELSLFGLENDSFIGVDRFNAIRNVQDSPLPKGRNAGFHYVIPEDGVYVLSIKEGSYGSYEMEIGVARPGLEENKEFNKQVIFLNMAGASLSLREFYESNDYDDKVREFSELKTFMANWDLDSLNQTRELAMKITDNFVKKLKSEIVETGINPTADVEIISDYGDVSRRDAILDLLELSEIPYSRIIVGGTQEEAGMETIGFSSGVDIGNFDLSNNAMVLLDRLSDKSVSNDQSINNIPITEGADKIDLVADVVGNIAVHETGHILGNTHTDNTTDTIGIIDKGGAIIRIAGILEGDAYGDPENVQVSFTKAEYADEEASFFGRNQTDVNTAFALTTSKTVNQKSADALKELMNKLNDLSTTPELISLKSYPNPQKITETSKLMIDLEVDSFLKVSLFDIQGRKISDLFAGDIKAGDPMELQMDPTRYNLKRGVYLYRIISKTGQKNKKLIIN